MQLGDFFQQNPEKILMSSPPVSRRLVFVMYSGIYFLNKNISIFGPPFSRSLVFVMYSFGLRWMSFLSKLEGNGHFSPVFFIFGLPLTALRFQDLKSWKNFSIFSGVTIYIYIYIHTYIGLHASPKSARTCSNEFLLVRTLNVLVSFVNKVYPIIHVSIHTCSCCQFGVA